MRDRWRARWIVALVVVVAGCASDEGGGGGGVTLDAATADVGPDGETDGETDTAASPDASDGGVGADGDPDAGVVADAMADAGLVDAGASDGGGGDLDAAGSSDAGVDGGGGAADTADAGPDAGPDAVDAGPPPVCSAPPVVAPTPSVPLYDTPGPLVGIDALERPLYEAIRTAALADPDLHFVATWDHESQRYRVDAAAGFVEFERTPGGIVFTAGDPVTVFGSTSPAFFGDMAEELSSFANPSGYTGEDVGYASGDPRVGFLSPALESFPLAFERIAALFDAPDAPDLVVGLRSWSSGPGGSHGALSALQSRSAIVLSGRGAREGVILDDAATLPDVAPTILAALGAPTTGGRGPDGEYADGLYMERQDGRVLWEALAEDPCERPRYALLLLFDGLSQNELLHQALDPDAEADVPTFRALVQGGVAYQYGATTNFPSVSAPGHMTSGSGAWSGHHGIISNAFYRRSAKKDINPFALLDDVQATIADPMKAVAIYEEALAGGFQTLAQAAHARFGDWDPLTGEGAFVAVINELPIGGADWTTVHLLLGAGPGPLALSLQEYDLADNLAVTQIEDLLGDDAMPVPLILEASLVKTDGAGEVAGPHGDVLRDTLEETDARVAKILKAYEDRGVLQDTLVVLVSDHGMELQDPLRTTGVGKSVSEAGVKARIHSPGLVWLPVLELEQASSELGLLVTVRDHDTGAPLAGATVGCDDCAPAVTGDDGQATLVPGPGATTVTATHPDFNPQQAPLEGL